MTVILSGKPSKCTFEGSDIRIFRIAIGNITKNESVEQMEHIKIFLHEKGKFIFFKFSLRFIFQARGYF